MYENRSREYYLYGSEERIEYTNSVWSELIRYNHFHRMGSVFIISLNLLNNALVCFEYGMYLSSVLTCRVVIESALYIATSNENMKVRKLHPTASNTNEYIGSYNSTKCAHLLMDLSLEGLKNEALKQKVIDKNTRKLIETLQEKGNMAAHFAQKQAKHYQRWVPKRATEVGIDKAIEDAGKICIFDPDEAKKILETTVKALIGIMEGTNEIKVVKD